MRISDWSSDVCSSDLSSTAGQGWGQRRTSPGRLRSPPWARCWSCCCGTSLPTHTPHPARSGGSREAPARARSKGSLLPPLLRDVCGSFGRHQAEQPLGIRSEEHTSELQSLMRRSYAVFCLKKTMTLLLILHTLFTTTYRNYNST